MPWKQIRSAAAAVLAGPWLIACTSIASVDDTLPALSDTAWTLAALPDGAVPAGSVPTLRFEAGRVQGSDGCNRYGAPYAATGGRLQIGPHVATTRMACPESASQFAAAFNTALTRARAYRIDGQALVLLDAAGATLASFAPQPTGLEGSAWRVSGYNNGRQAVVTVQTGTALTVEFLPDGRLRGSAGCNNYVGSYAATGNGLTLAALAATRKACPQPEGVMAQEAAFLRALETVASAQREGDTLELRTASGALAARMTAGANPNP